MGISLGLTHVGRAEPKKLKPLRILILGGTAFLGPHQIKHALARGHKITTFTRGQTEPTVNREVFERVESLIGDRNDNLNALEGRKWDAVIDNQNLDIQETNIEIIKTLDEWGWLGSEIKKPEPTDNKQLVGGIKKIKE